MSNDTPRTETIKTIMKCALFISDEEFTSSDIESSLAMHKSTAHSALVSMYQKGLVNRRKGVHNSNTTIHWSNRKSKHLRVAWRLSQDSEIGILPVVGPREWGLGEIAV